MKAVIYAAKSTTDEKGSIPTQINDARDMAAREGWDVAAEYSDEAASAWSGDRGPGLEQALEQAELLAPSVLVVQHSDRLARGDGRQARHLAELYFWALKCGVEVRSVQDDSTFSNPILAVALGERNAEDSRRKSLAVAAGAKRRAERGLATGGPRPYGYEYAADKSGLMVVQAEAVVVRRIFADTLTGKAQLAITRELTEQGIPTIRGGRWHQGTVRSILANPVYCGRISHNGEVFDGEHEAIVDAETWEKVAKLREARRRGPGAGRGRPPAGQHLFRGGLLRCECGEAMVPRTATNRASDPYEVYYCYGRKRDVKSCEMPPVKREEIDTAVYTYFEQVGLDVDATREQLLADRDRNIAEIDAVLEAARGEEAKARGRLDRVRRDYTDGELTAAEWRELRGELESQLAGAQAERAQQQDRRTAVERWGAVADAEAETLRHLAAVRAAIAGEITSAADVAAVRAILERIFDHFIVRRSAARVHAELAWVGDASLVIDPVVSEQAIEGYSEAMRPILKREGIAAGTAWPLDSIAVPSPDPEQSRAQA